jgi:serine/threonine-protein kinase
MALPAGLRFGSYEIVGTLGEGGMGAVYRARDTRLNRDVAVKVLRPEVATDGARLARFEREAQILASLNHPHIAQVYGLDTITSPDGGAAQPVLVLELIEGPTLADRLDSSRMAQDEALKVAAQIALALEAAHEQGIVHRDLKPANIKVRADGVVKVLDFGLAKAMEALGGAGRAGSGNLQPQPSSLDNLPTVTSPAVMTGVGVLLGTAAYMSPEQARGQAVDRRTDIWAFGCVLFEMLTGTRPFEAGTTVSDSIASILTKEPDWSALPQDLPKPIDTLLRRCLSKDASKRLPHIGLARFEIEDAMRGAAPGGGPSASMSPSRPLARQLFWSTAAIALLAAGVGVGRLFTASRSADAVSFPTRFMVTPSPGIVTNLNMRQIAISADGLRVVYVGARGNNALLFSRRLDQLDAAEIPGATLATAPFLSPDGRVVAFTERYSLKRMPVEGGAPVTLTDVPNNAFLGGFWRDNGDIVFSVREPGRGLVSIKPSGGEPRVLTKPDQAHGELFHGDPAPVFGHDSVLFTIYRDNGNSTDVAALDLKSGEYHVLVTGAHSPRHVEPDVLVFGAGEALRAVRLDTSRMQTVGEPVIVLDRIRTRPGVADYAISRTGTLVYRAGLEAGQSGQPRSLAWLSRDGQEERVDAPPHSYTVVRLSPDGTRLALDVREGTSQVWTWDLTRGTLTRLNPDQSDSDNPLWSPDSRRIFFRSARNGTYQVFAQAADGSTPAEQVTNSPNSPIPKAIDPEGRRLLVLEQMPRTGPDINMVTLGGDGVPQPLVAAPGGQNNPDITPDGRWVAYDSDESGTNEVYVRPFPDVNAGRWQISAGGGSRPTWSKNGRELLFVDPSGYLMVAPVRFTPTFNAGRATRFLPTANFSSNSGPRTYDSAGNGDRIIASTSATGAQTVPSGYVVVERWADEVKRQLASGSR